MLSIFRGDTTTFEVDFTEFDGSLSGGRTLTLTIRDFEDGNIIASKSTALDGNKVYKLKLSKEEGKKLKGSYCVADLEVSSDTDINTIWKSDLRIIKDVTHD